MHTSYKVSDRSYLAILKKDIHSLAVEIGLSEKRIAETDIVVAELASNLVKHADNGLILCKPIGADSTKGIEIIGIDEGPGIADINRMLLDGVSTKNTLGHGLGALKRLTDIFQIYTQKDWGTVSLIRIFNEKQAKQKPDILQTGDVVMPKPGETHCGDAFFRIQGHRYIKVFLGDGLGHGRDAAHAVQTAGDAFAACEDNEPTEIIRYINNSVKKTRGLVGTVAVFDVNSLKWRLCGVGNIATKFIGPTTSKAHISYNGIIGLNLPNTLNSQEVPYEKEQYLIMCSDGIKSRWDVSKLPAVFRYDLTVLASAIFKDFTRNTDDSSVAVCKINL